MDGVEQAEVRIRQEAQAAVALPGPPPRARLLVFLKKPFFLVKTIPVLLVFTRNDYVHRIRGIPVGSLQEHLTGIDISSRS